MCPRCFSADAESDEATRTTGIQSPLLAIRLDAVTSIVLVGDRLGRCFWLKEENRSRLG